MGFHFYPAPLIVARETGDAVLATMRFLPTDRVNIVWRTQRMGIVATQMRSDWIFFLVIEEPTVNDPIFTKRKQHKAHVIIMAVIIAVISAFCYQVQLIFVAPATSKYGPTGLGKDQVELVWRNSLGAFGQSIQEGRMGFGRFIADEDIVIRTDFGISYRRILAIRTHHVGKRQSCAIKQFF